MLSFVPMPFTAVIMTTAMPAAKSDFLIEDDAGGIVTNDLEIRQRCKVTRMP